MDEPAEALLSRLFAKFTGAATVGPDDSFFDLGGDSMSGLRLVLELRATLGKAVDLGGLFAAPTVRQLALTLAGEEQASRWTSLVPLHTDRAGTPIFTVHWIPRKLAQHLGQKYPVYGLHFGLNHNIGFEQMALPKSVEGVAARYVEEIRALQPRGPYRIIGYSFGGLVAYEAACQLAEGGEAVELLCLVDTWDPAAYAPPEVLPLGRQIRNLFAAKPSLAGRLAKKFVRKIRSLHAEWQKRRRGEPLTEKFTSMALLFELARRYEPRPFDGKIDFFKAQRQETSIRFAERPPIESRWTELAAGGLEIHMVPGDHRDMFAEAAAGLLAAKIDACLERFRASSA